MLPQMIGLAALTIYGQFQDGVDLSNQKVKILINEQSWNLSLVRALLDLEETQAIIRTPLPSKPCDDNPFGPMNQMGLSRLNPPIGPYGTLEQQIYPALSLCGTSYGL